MGYTSHTVSLIEKVIKEYNPKSVIDAGAQNLYNQPLLPAPYASTFYESLGIEYQCVDLSGENNAHVWDLGTELKNLPQSDLFVCAGTMEHIGRNGEFCWEAVYNCFLNYHRMTKINGIQIRENPLTKNWPSHGWNYLGSTFYSEFCLMSDYILLENGIHPALGNIIDGYNLWAILKKTGERFPSLEEFKTLPIKQS